MGRLIVTDFVTLDGAIGAPGFDEHRSGRNAWALRLTDDDMQRYNIDQLQDAAALPLGRTTYQIASNMARAPLANRVRGSRSDRGSRLRVWAAPATDRNAPGGALKPR